MARQRRYFATGLSLHVIQRGNNRTATFLVDDDYRAYLCWLRRASAKHGVAIHALVLMKNHVHILVTPQADQSLPRMMQCIGSGYVPYFNKRHGRTGGLWEGRYRAFPVDSDLYLLACHRYIELNPVRAGMVERPEQYAWSSYRVNACGVEDPLITLHPALRLWVPDDPARQTSYRRLCEADLAEEELQAIRDAVHYGWALGGGQFVADVEGRCGRPAARRTSGPNRGPDSA